MVPVKVLSNMSAINVSFKKSLKLFSLMSLAALALCVPAEVKPACASSSTAPGCDSSFMSAIKQKAWMEAQREIMIAQSIIAKPDSVFVLGCFDHWYDELDIKFSNGTKYNISSVVSSYISSAFPHSLGGGHYSGSQSTNNCGTMSDLWNNARCSNLGSSAGQLGTLTDMSSYDRGSFPTSCSSGGSWSGPLNTFKNKSAGNSVGAGFDDMNLFGSVTLPVSEAGSCSAGIPTGVKISTGSSSTIDEIVCPNPGCTPNGASPQKCCKATVSSSGVTYGSCS